MYKHRAIFSGTNKGRTWFWHDGCPLAMCRARWTDRHLCAVLALLIYAKGWVKAASNTVKKFTICGWYWRWCSGCSGKGYATTARLGL